ncbi:ABC transporter permease [Funiculus sociatus GB2-A5]|uniref:ABC transporter permease n=1 Tax=Funiculus sociatus GB2-A5 TaxID=2933946 RepID=A0ABV0JUU8_9CYAN|nr:ABC transporter permease [Trichocoleus sp. FACHB-6]MBD2063612.1 ABC transporter permease [Trichocoleus sp. FACHB-6]
MNWWQKLKNNPLARSGAVLLIVFYFAVIFADFVAPYRPCDTYDLSNGLCDVQPNTSLLEPTKIYWRNQAGEFIGPHVYPTTQGPTDIETGDRKLTVNFQKPSPVRFFVRGAKYQLFQLRLPLPPKFDEVEIFPGIPLDWHLFGAVGEGKLNLLGTDEQGRDQFSRLLHGGRISLSIGLVGIIISFPLGMLAGGISGYVGGWVDGILMRAVEVLMTIPSLYLLVSLAAVLPLGLSSAQRFLLIVLITSFIGWAGLARVIRGQVLSIKEREFVQAARAMGAKPLYIIVRHVLPQTATYIIISATLAVPGFIVAESVLSLIGLGIQQPDPSWGNMLSLATNASILVLQPWLIWPPALLIILTVLAFNLLGDGLRDALDPRSLRR